MRQRIIRSGTLIVVLVGALLFASAGTAQANARGTAAAKSSTDCLQPPNNVDHATFTAAQLALYGLPQRAPGEPLSHWQEVVRAAQHHFCTGTPTNHYSHGYRAATFASGREDGPNWAGYAAINWGYSEVEAYWNVPCLTLQLKDGDSLAWIGLGGDASDGGGPLAQTGTGQDEYQDIFRRWVANYYAWYEDVPGQPLQRAFGVNCGDSIYARVSQTVNGALMYLSDNTNHNYLSQVNSQISNGSTAEWIVERPTVGSQYSALSDFNYVNFTSGYATQWGYYYNLYFLPSNQIYMWNNIMSQILADAGGLGGNGDFTVNWHHSGP